MYYDFAIKLALREAEQSTHDKARHGAVIFRKKSLISSAHNKPFAWTNRLSKEFRKWNHGIHAEAAAILSARQDLRGADILVLRLGRGGAIRLSKPCSFCAAYLQYVGIRTVIYSNENGGFSMMRI